MKKILIKIIKSFLWIFITLLSLLLIYILFNLNLFHHTRALPAEKLGRLLQQDISNPNEFVAKQFDNHDIVFLGELHKRKQDLDFFRQLIPYLYHNKQISCIGWEFGAAQFQPQADSIVNANSFDRDKAITLMRNSLYYWCYEEYLDIFKTIWEFNKNLPADSTKIRFLQLNKPYNPRGWNAADPATRLKERETNFDNLLPDIIEKEIIQPGKKILIYCGLHHSLTRFKTPVAFFLKDQSGRAGQRLFAKYPQKVFQITLLSPFPPRWNVYNELTRKDAAFVYPFEGVFNQLYDSLKHPFAVSSANPVFGQLKDYNSFYAFDKASGVRLKDFTDGCIMLESFDKVEPVHIIPDWVNAIEELEAIKAILPEKDTAGIKTIEDLRQYINAPLDIQGIRKFHQLKKFW